MEKKNKIGTLIKDAGNTAKGVINTAVKAADQNDDGKFDFSDVSAIADTMGKSIKKGAVAVKGSVDEHTRMYDLKILQPIFLDTMNSADFLMPKFIRIVPRDKRRAESEVCQGSIGYFSTIKGLGIVNVFYDSVDIWGLTFYPDSESEFYYVDPSDRDSYIALDEYFGYLKLSRINELQKIAQDLGAKYFKITYKEEQTSFSEHTVKAKANAKAPAKNTASADTTHNSVEKKYATVEVAAEMQFPGHPPKKPHLKYLQRDPSIQNLVAMRLDKTSPLMHQKLVLKLSNSSGMKENDAIKIDAVLKGLKFSGNTTVASEAKNESRRYLEYDIEF